MRRRAPSRISFVQFADQVDTPLLQTEHVVDAELKPVETLRVAAESAGRVDIVPNSA